MMRGFLEKTLYLINENKEVIRNTEKMYNDLIDELDPDSEYYGMKCLEYQNLKKDAIEKLIEEIPKMGFTVTYEDGYKETFTTEELLEGVVDEPDLDEIKHVYAEDIE